MSAKRILVQVVISVLNLLSSGCAVASVLLQKVTIIIEEKASPGRLYCKYIADNATGRLLEAASFVLLLANYLFVMGLVFSPNFIFKASARIFPTPTPPRRAVPSRFWQALDFVFYNLSWFLFSVSFVMFMLDMKRTTTEDGERSSISNRYCERHEKLLLWFRAAVFISTGVSFQLFYICNPYKDEDTNNSDPNNGIGVENV